MIGQGGLVEQARRIESLDTLRGFAALSVCWFHFTGNLLVGEGLLRGTGTYGWLGVQVFFVITGFVIPLALYREQYRPVHYKTYLLKRFARLYPPYLASIAVVLALLVAQKFYKGNLRIDIEGEALLLHLVFLNDFLGKPWLNTVYWTLAIEIQFYLLLGLIFPFVIARRQIVRWLTYSVLALPAFIDIGPVFIFPFIFLFLMGMLTLQYHLKVISLVEFFLGLGLFTVGCLGTLGLPAAIAGLFAVGAILGLKKGTRLLNAVGRVSYSLYLLHGSIGSLALYMSLTYLFGSSQLDKVGAVIFAVLVSLIVAYLGYYLIELPALKSSRLLRYAPVSEISQNQVVQNLQASARRRV